MAEVHDYDVPLFDVPPKYRPPKHEQTWPIYRHYTGKRTSCDDCILAIANGDPTSVVGFAAYVRADAQGRRYLCVLHTQVRREIEGTYITKGKA